MTDYFMMRRPIFEEYRRLNARDRNTFRRWLMLNIVVGAFLVTVMAATSILVGSKSSSLHTANDGVQRVVAK